jgi:ABC-type polysaccharide transport system permease subunit
MLPIVLGFFLFAFVPLRLVIVFQDYNLVEASSAASGLAC